MYLQLGSHSMVVYGIVAACVLIVLARLLMR
jgi:hypothetical protein